MKFLQSHLINCAHPAFKLTKLEVLAQRLVFYFTYFVVRLYKRKENVALRVNGDATNL